jgi:ABC-type transport system involved in multi-copper enzyme maturation permease subunit
VNSSIRSLLVVAQLALQEAIRKRVLAVVGVLTVGSSALYLAGCLIIRHNLNRDLGFTQNGVIKPLVPATLLGLASFATLFLGSVLAVFLTAGAVRGDADRGLVQPLVVRPLGRTTYLGGRALAAVTVSVLYVLIVSVLATVATRVLFSNLPPHAWLAIPRLVLAVAVVTLLTLLVSCLLSTVATGISVLMAYGAGLIAGLLGQIAQAFGSNDLSHIATGVSYLLPFEALYRDALSQLSPTGPLGQLVQLGPLGGANGAGPGLWLYSLAYLIACGVAASLIFARADL